VEGITVDGGGGLRVGAGEEKVRDSVLVLRLTFVGTCSLFMDSVQTFHAFVLEYIRLADRPRFLVDAWSQRTMEAGSIGSEWLQKLPSVCVLGSFMCGDQLYAEIRKDVFLL
jgi:hypothetical protein